MQQKRKLQHLTDVAGQVTFPTDPDRSFTQFQEVLREVVCANLGYSISKTLEYDADEQVFWITIGNSAPLEGYMRNESAHGYDKGTSLSLVKQIKIHPSEPIEPQIARALEIQEHISKRVGKLQVLLELYLDGDLTSK